MERRVYESFNTKMKEGEANSYNDEDSRLAQEHYISDDKD
jgi:hypothetical protein